MVLLDDFLALFTCLGVANMQRNKNILTLTLYLYLWRTRTRSPFYTDKCITMWPKTNTKVLNLVLQFTLLGWQGDLNKKKNTGQRAVSASKVVKLADLTGQGTAM